MNYLFFDIESPNGHPDSICEFGYVIYDENFKEIKEDVILINPECFFKVLTLKKEEISFKYNIRKYYKSPRFDEVYLKIKNILLNKETLIFGFSVDNDECYVLGTSKRYKLELFDFVSYDVQTLYCKCMKCKSIGLDKMAKELLSEEEIKRYREHYSLDDAKITAACFIKLLEKFNLTIKDSLKIMGESHALNIFKKREKNKEEKLNSIRINRKPWDEYVKNYKINSKNKYTCLVHESIFKNNSNVLRSLMYVKEHNYIPTNNIKLADIVILSGPKEFRLLNSKTSLKRKKIVMIEEIKL